MWATCAVIADAVASASDQSPATERSTSVGRVLPHQLVLEAVHGRDRVNTDLPDRVEPLLPERLGGSLPKRKLVRRQLINTTRLGPQLDVSGTLEFVEGAATLAAQSLVQCSSITAFWAVDNPS